MKVFEDKNSNEDDEDHQQGNTNSYSCFGTTRYWWRKQINLIYTFNKNFQIIKKEKKFIT